jgi:ribonuclease VapC
VIVDTSALVALARREDGYEAIRNALLSEAGIIPTPVLVELHRVMAGPGNFPDPQIDQLITVLQGGRIAIAPLSVEAARAAVDANARYGTGNGRGGTLNMLDLMVYGAAVTSGRPILCTGRDFAATDAAIHPASRPG